MLTRFLFLWVFFSCSHSKNIKTPYVWFQHKKPNYSSVVNGDIALKKLPRYDTESGPKFLGKKASKNLSFLYFMRIQSQELLYLSSDIKFINNFFAKESRLKRVDYEKKKIFACLKMPLNLFRQLKAEVKRHWPKLKLEVQSLVCKDTAPKHLVFVHPDWVLHKIDPHGHAFYQLPYFHYMVTWGHTEQMKKKFKRKRWVGEKILGDVQ
jgi:hypothetical protein